jgi:signal transduction histidine kinase
MRLSATLVLTMGVGFLARQLVQPGAGEAGPLLLLTLAIMAGAWYGGLVPGLVGTACGAMFAAYYFIEPIYSFAIAQPSSGINLLFFILGGIIASCLCELRRRADEDRRSARRNEFDALAEANRLRTELHRATADLDQVERMLERHLTPLGAAASESIRQTGHSILRYLQLARSGPQAQRIDGGAVVESAIHNCAPLLHACNGKVVFDGLPVVEGHYDQLVELFTELLTNAIKFRGEERLKIRITAAQVGDGWLFLVSDNGSGIEKSRWDDVFLPFEPGFGLALCRRIVENHNGRISLESIRNIGTTVRFTILRAAAPSAAWTFASRPESASTACAPGY